VKRALLDVNVLIALLDAGHVDHDRARTWLDGEIAAGWASCAITQNGFVRIISQPRYPGSISATHAIALLSHACETAHHAFWTCDLSLLDPDVILGDRVHGPRQVTDVYLLALAAHRGGRFVTFDQAIPVSAAPRASEENLVVLA
jgi:toxin-antitoxin system PIN domain toxin